jgi:hypothetical protein
VFLDDFRAKYVAFRERTLGQRPEAQSIGDVAIAPEGDRSDRLSWPDP